MFSCKVQWYTLDTGWMERAHTTDHKVKAICQAPQPRNICQLRAFLGMLQYYGKFIPHLATLLQPLNALLCKDTKWRWTMECEKAFMEDKEALSPQLWSIMTLKFHSNLQLMPQPMGWERLFLMFSQTGQSVPLPMSSRY